MRFEGEYLNEERLIGKLYDNNGHCYCDLKNANGLIEEFNKNGNLEFEGEYLNGKRNGNGKEYDCGILIFEGDYLNGKRNGKGKEYDYGELIFEGEYLNDKKNGIGKEYDYAGKLVYKGEYKKGEKVKKQKQKCQII